MTIQLRGLILVLVALLPLAAEAQQPFDAVVSGESVFGCHIVPIIEPGVVWVNPDRVEQPTDIAMVASGDGRRVFAVTEGSPYRVVQVEPSGAQTAFHTGTGRALGLAVADDGRVYVVTDDPRLDRISPSGTLEASYPLGTVPPLNGPFDVAPDNCTIFYSRGGVISRINGCTGASLPDFASVPFVSDIEVLPDGQVLLTEGNAVRLYSAAGALVRTVASITAYGFDSDRFEAAQASLRDGVLWIAVVNRCEASSSLLRVSFATGAELSRRPLPVLNTASGLVIGAATASIPTLSEMVMVLLVLVLAAGGSVALKLR
jgi:hypothetical protein